jgi:hypothetical protein
MIFNIFLQWHKWQKPRADRICIDSGKGATALMPWTIALIFLLGIFICTGFRGKGRYMILF